MAEFTLIRARAGEQKALDEYAAWVRKAVPKELEHQTITCFEPMWTYPDHPAIAEAARWLFNDPQIAVGAVAPCQGNAHDVFLLPRWKLLHVTAPARGRRSAMV